MVVYAYILIIWKIVVLLSVKCKYVTNKVAYFSYMIYKVYKYSIKKDGGPKYPQHIQLHRKLIPKPANCNFCVLLELILHIISPTVGLRHIAVVDVWFM